MTSIKDHTTVPKNGVDQGEHGAGIGLSGGHGIVGSKNTQSGIAAAEEREGFNHGLGGEHASGGIPKNLPGGAGGYGHGATVSGAYEGGGTGNALTGQSQAHTTGAGVGAEAAYATPTPIADKFTHTSSKTTQTTGQTVIGEGINLPPAGVRGADLGAPLTGGGYGGVTREGIDPSTAQGPGYGKGFDNGVGPAGGAGGHYGSTGGVGQGVSDEYKSGGHGKAGLAGAAVGVGAAGGAYGATKGADADGRGGTAGVEPVNRYGSGEDSYKQGAPLSDPDALDTGGPHSLVYKESEGKYVHRRELDGVDGL